MNPIARVRIRSQIPPLLIRTRLRHGDRRIGDRNILVAADPEFRIGSNYYGARLNVWTFRKSVRRRRKAPGRRSNVKSSGYDLPTLPGIYAPQPVSRSTQASIYKLVRTDAKKSPGVVPVDQVVGPSTLHQPHFIEVIKVCPIVAVEIVVVDVVVISRSKRNP